MAAPEARVTIKMTNSNVDLEYEMLLLTLANNTFDKFKNESSRFSLYISKELMIHPKEQIIDYKMADKFVKVSFQKVPKNISFHYIPL